LISKIHTNKLSQSRDATPMPSCNNSFIETDIINKRICCKPKTSINDCQYVKTLARVGSVVDLTCSQRKQQSKNNKYLENSYKKSMKKE
jgi:hypothetical protein